MCPSAFAVDTPGVGANQGVDFGLDLHVQLAKYVYLYMSQHG